MRPVKKRIIVDGVDFGQLFRFPMIFRAVTASMQVPRLLIGLAMVIILLLGGRAWDAATDNTIAPGQLAGVGSTSVDPESTLREAIRLFVPQEDWPERAPERWPDDATAWIAPIERGYANASRDWSTRLSADEIAARELAYEQMMVDLRAAKRMGPYQASAAHISASLGTMTRGAFVLNVSQTVGGVRDLFINLPVNLWRASPTFVIFYGLFFLIVCSVGGGALSRMSACQNAQQERLRIRDALGFVRDSSNALVSAPLLPLITVAIAAAGLFGLGILMIAPGLNVIGSVLYGVALLLGCLLAFLLVGYAIGLPLLIPAVACENCSAGDAMQRAYAYVIQRPVHLALYYATALVGLAVGFAVVSVFASLTLNLTASIYGAVAGSESPMSVVGGVGLFDLRTTGGVEQTGWTNVTAASVLGFWQRLIVLLVGAYVMSYLFSASTIAYLLVRRASDGQDVDEIWQAGLTPGTMAPQPVVSARPKLDVQDASDDAGDVDSDADADAVTASESSE
ncbi:MAG: hypothetical protein AAF432_07665 [Planctomycetota bacterium]